MHCCTSSQWWVLLYWYLHDLFVTDIVFGMPATSPGDLDSEIRNEHQKYLIAELDVKVVWIKHVDKWLYFIIH